MSTPVAPHDSTSRDGIRAITCPTTWAFAAARRSARPTQRWPAIKPADRARPKIRLAAKPHWSYLVGCTVQHCWEPPISIQASIRSIRARTALICAVSHIRHPGTGSEAP